MTSLNSQDSFCSLSGQVPKVLKKKTEYITFIAAV